MQWSTSTVSSTQLLHSITLKTSKCVAKEDSQTLFSQKFKLTENDLLRVTLQANNRVKSRFQVQSNSLSCFPSKWWFSGWKLCGWMASFRNAEVCLCNNLLTDLQSISPNLLCFWHLRRIDVYWTVSISNIGHSSVTSSREWEKFIHVRPLTLVDSCPGKLTIISGAKVNMHVCTNAQTQTLEPWAMPLNWAI